MDIQRNLDYLYGLTRFGIKTGLGNIRKLCREMGDPQNAYSSIHIAGTNGKGTTCAMLASILKEAGYKVGLYTSPHLVKFGERIRVGDSLFSDEETSAYIEEFRPLFDNIGATFFESATALAFCHFARQGIDIAVVETGLGGELDATNIIPARMAVFTPISLDHTDRLGKEISQIAADKAGIIKYGSITISSLQASPALEQIENRAKILDSEFHYAPREIALGERVTVSFDSSSVELDCRTDSSLSGDYRLPPPGRHQITNLQTVLSACRLFPKIDLKVSPAEVKTGVEKVHWGGRLEIIRRKPLTYYDVAHNPAAAKVVADFFREVFPNAKCRIVMGIVDDKDYISVLEALNPCAADFTFVNLPNPRTLEAYELLKTGGKLGLKGRVIENAQEAIETVTKETGGNEIILIVGSHYLGEAVYGKI